MNETQAQKKAQPDTASVPRARHTQLPTSEQKTPQASYGLAQRMTVAPTQLTTRDVLYLQRTMGNRAVARLLGRERAPHTQAAPPQAPGRLTVGAVNDRYAQDENRMDYRVSRRAQGQNRSQTVRRHADPSRPVAYQDGGQLSTSVEHSIRQARTGGRMLDKNVRGSMEKAFGAGFSGVRLHTDQKADSLNRSLDAQAFTVGRDIFFRRGSYEPDSQPGQHLIAHELTHVVQQSGGVQRDVIQRAVGFEFEVGGYIVEQLSTPLTKQQKAGTDTIPDTQIDDSNLKKGLPLIKTSGFEMQLDEGSDDYHLEFVTDPPGFPEGSSGRRKLTSTMKSMTSTADKVIEKSGASPILRTKPDGYTSQVVPLKTAGGKSTTPEIIIHNGGLMYGEPQATAGIRLDQVANMMETALGTGANPLETTEDKQRLGPGRGALTSKSPTDAAIMGPSPGAARLGIQQWIDINDDTHDQVPPGFGSDQLVSLLAMISVYMKIASNPISPYPKVIAPLMARTDYAKIFQLLPQAEQDYLTADAQRFVTLALRAADMVGTRALPVFTGGFTQLSGIDDDDTRDDISDAIQQLTRGDWLTGLVQGTDKLTKEHFPSDLAKPWMESLGSLGDKTENVGKKRWKGTSTKTAAPIFELRRMQASLNHKDWLGYAQDVFEFISGVNDLKNPTYASTNQTTLYNQRRAKERAKRK